MGGSIKYERQRIDIRTVTKGELIRTISCRAYDIPVPIRSAEPVGHSPGRDAVDRHTPIYPEKRKQSERVGASTDRDKVCSCNVSDCPVPIRAIQGDRARGRELSFSPHIEQRIDALGRCTTTPRDGRAFVDNNRDKVSATPNSTHLLRKSTHLSYPEPAANTAFTWMVPPFPEMKKHSWTFCPRPAIKFPRRPGYLISSPTCPGQPRIGACQPHPQGPEVHLPY